jgi:phosphoheptose isomerase
LLRDFFAHHTEIFSHFARLESGAAEQAARLISRTFENDGRLYIFGTGLSSHFARYMAALFSDHYAGSRPALPAISLESVSTRSDEDLFGRQVSALITDKDALFGISAEVPYDAFNKAFHSASLCGAKTIALSGAGSNRLKTLCDVVIDVDMMSYPDVQEVQLFIIHAVSEMVDRLMFRQV